MIRVNEVSKWFRYLGKVWLEMFNYLVLYDYVIILIYSDYFGKFEFCFIFYSEYYNVMV